MFTMCPGPPPACPSRSGMLPGYVSGFYSYDECHIDLARLAAFSQARLVHAEAVGIDTKVGRVITHQCQRLALTKLV